MVKKNMFIQRAVPEKITTRFHFQGDITKKRSPSSPIDHHHPDIINPHGITINSIYKSVCFKVKNRRSLQVGALNQCENIGQLGWLLPINGKIQVMFQTPNQSPCFHDEKTLKTLKHLLQPRSRRLGCRRHHLTRKTEPIRFEAFQPQGDHGHINN